MASGKPSHLVIFYTPSNTETRIALVDNLMTYWFEFRANNEHDATIFAAWGNIKGKINSLKNTRNAIAHGSITHYTSGNNILNQRPRLSPAFGDTLRFMPQRKRANARAWVIRIRNSHRRRWPRGGAHYSFKRSRSTSAFGSLWL
jgi:hypothetical protein